MASNKPRVDANKFKVVKPAAVPAGSRLALLDQIGALHALKSEMVTLDGPDGTPSGVVVEVRELPTGARIAIGEDASEPAGEDEDGNALTRTKMSVFTPRMIQATCYDPASGELLWTLADLDQILALPQRVTAPLFAAALRVSGQGDADEEDGPGNADSGATDTGSISSPTS